jgi:hypothetical protein
VLLQQNLLQLLWIHVLRAYWECELDLVVVLVKHSAILCFLSRALLHTFSLELLLRRSLFDLLLLNFFSLLLRLCLCVHLLLEHQLYLRLCHLVLLFILILNLLLAAFNQSTFIVLRLLNCLHLFLLLQDFDLVTEQIEVLLLDDLDKVLFWEWELLRVFFVLILEILEQHLLLVVIQFI